MHTHQQYNFLSWTGSWNFNEAVRLRLCYTTWCIGFGKVGWVYKHKLKSTWQSSVLVLKIKYAWHHLVNIQAGLSFIVIT